MNLRLEIRMRKEAVGCGYSKDIQKELIDEKESLHPNMRKLVEGAEIEFDESQEPSISLYEDKGSLDFQHPILNMFYNEIDLAGLQKRVIELTTKEEK